MPYVSDGSFEEPEATATIWRYLDLAKFVSLLTTGSLYFPRADCLRDEFEGSYPPLSVRSREQWEVAETERLRGLGFSPDMAADRARSIGPIHRQMAKMVHISCWSLDEDESVALWNMYSTIKYGVALRSTFSRLTNAINASEYDIRAGKVRYIDYDREAFSENYLLAAFQYKRKSYKFEREVRAVALDVPQGGSKRLSDDGPPGLAVPVDLAKLVDCVRIAPLAPTWFGDLIRSLIRQFSPGIPDEQSDLAKTPAH